MAAPSGCSLLTSSPSTSIPSLLGAPCSCLLPPGASDRMGTAELGREGRCPPAPGPGCATQPHPRELPGFLFRGAELGMMGSRRASRLGHSEGGWLTLTSQILALSTLWVQGGNAEGSETTNTQPQQRVQSIWDLAFSWEICFYLSTTVQTGEPLLLAAPGCPCPSLCAIPAPWPRSGPCAVPAAPGRTRQDNESSGKPSPAPPAGTC